MYELWFLCMKHHLNVRYKCMKFQRNTSNGYQVIEGTQKSIANDQREITPKILQSRVMILVHDTLSHCALEVYVFNQIAFKVFNLQSEQKMDLVMLQWE